MELLFPLLFMIPFILVGGVLGVWIWALIDALQVPADIFYRTGSKILWGVLIGVMGPLAAVVYFAVGRPDRATRQWIAAQRAAGVDLSPYRIYDQGFTRPSAPYGPTPYGPGPYGPNPQGFSPSEAHPQDLPPQVSPPPGTGSTPHGWPPGEPGTGYGPPPGYPPGPPPG